MTGRVLIRDSIAANVVIDENGCHVWQRCRTRDGYGLLSDGERLVYAHRFVYEQANGPTGDGIDVDHICFNSSCVNLEHLRPLDRLENAKRQRSAVKTHCVHGHEYTPENTYRRPADNRRQCKECRRLRCIKWRRARSAAA